MLKSTFQHIPGIGEKIESYLWRNNILTWDSFQNIDYFPLSNKYNQALKKYVPISFNALDNADINFFAEGLPNSQLWRLFPNFRNYTAYIDIETTGMFFEYHNITTISLYNGRDIYTYIKGKNLQDFISEIQKYKMIVTYNGKKFDIPFIEYEFRTSLPQIHIDLRYLLKSLGYTGGLKKCEEKLGIRRKKLKGVDGYYAVLLWEEYIKNQTNNSLETLLAYNVEDVLNLEKVLVIAYNKKLQNYPEIKPNSVSSNTRVQNPYKPDQKLIRKIKKRIEQSRQFFW